MIIDLLLSRDGNAWRVYAAGWVPPSLRSELDNYGERFPLPEPDLDELERFMWAIDAPFTFHRPRGGGVELSARGRSAVALSVWLEGWICTAGGGKRSAG